MAENDYEKRTFEIELPEYMWQVIDRLAAAQAPHLDSGQVEALVTELLDHVQQGVRRSGSWERPWLERVIPLERIDEAYVIDDDPAYQAGHIDRDGNLKR